ncbi:flagellar hook-length control protein FliK [Lautropia mirabilis]|uniref:flagellar hook-length control protein FliK n=1 Tax=Lautropia mirabilis TaxID=47671 RepID=UPI00234A76A5|nr:flagellar hook-length control protein FliK [Lautropia mirabilis]MDC6094589.1 flagellar hook-length control protein FliK [Lautropia mirabilis]
MKTESSLGTRSPVSSGKSVLEQLSASRTPAKAGRDAASSLSFRTLMADIRPGGFEEMTQRMAERRAEQQRLEKERQRERPRAEDLHGSAQVMQRPAAEPERSRQADEMRQAERVTKASRQAERATTTNSRDADNASARGASTTEAHPASARAEEGRPAAPSATQAAIRTAASESGSTSAPGDKVDTDSTAAAATANQATAASDAAAAGAASAQAAKAVDRQASSGSSKPAELATADVPAKSSSPSSSEDSLADQVRQGAQVQMEASPVSESELQQLARQMGLDESDTQDVNAPTEAQGTSADAATLTKDITAVDTGENLSSGGGGTATVHPTMAMAPSRRAQAASASATQPAQDGRVAAAGRPSTSPALPQTSPASDAASASRPATTDTSPTPLPTAAVATGRAEGGSFSLGMAMPTPGAHSPVRTDGSPLLSSRIESPIHSAEFKEQFARQVAGVVVQGQDRAEIRLTPAELGPIRIRVSLNAEDAALDISAAHAATRAAIESSMSTLKQMLADHGLRLSDYRMDQGNNTAFLSQQRQSGQENGAGMQQSGTAFGQNGGQSGGQQADGGSDTGRAGRTMGSRPTAVSGSTSGGARVGNTPSNGRLDLFA